MPSNNTENVYATPFIEGTGNPIPASRISYDGTGTSIEATDVQAAITELDTDLQSTKDDVDTLKSEVRNKWFLSEIGNVKVTRDGVKTFKELLEELNTAALTKIHAMDDDEIFVPKALITDGWLNATFSPGYTNTAVTHSAAFTRMWLDASHATIRQANVAESSSQYEANVLASPIAIADYSANVPTSGSDFVYYYYIYKKA